MPRPEEPLEYAPTGELYLGSWIRQARLEKGISRDQLAERLHRHPGTLSRIEVNTAKPGDRLLLELAALLEMPLEELRRAPLHPRIIEHIKTRQKAKPHLAPAAAAAEQAVAPPAQITLADFNRLVEAVNHQEARIEELSQQIGRLIQAQQITTTAKTVTAASDPATPAVYGAQAAASDLTTGTSQRTGGNDHGATTAVEDDEPPPEGKGTGQRLESTSTFDSTNTSLLEDPYERRRELIWRLWTFTKQKKLKFGLPLWGTLPCWGTTVSGFCINVLVS